MTNPNSTAQQTVRTALSNLVADWGGLSAAIRDGWATYALNVPKTNPLGDPIFLSGQQWYLACNVARVRAAMTQVDTAPTVYSEAILSPVTIAPDAAAATFDVAFDNTDQWANENTGALIVQVSRQMNASRNFFKGPFRFAAKTLGSTITPPTSPATLTNPFAETYTAGNRVYARARAVLADGRISAVQIVTGLAA